MCGVVVLQDCSPTDAEEPLVLVRHTQSRLAVDFAGGGVDVALLRE